MLEKLNDLRKLIDIECIMIKYEKKDGIGIIRLNRPEKRNVLHPDLVEDLKKQLDVCREDKEIRVVILTGEGKSFCAGADLEYLNDLRNYSVIQNEKDSGSLAELFLKIYEFPKPVIAAVNGAAIAGGCGLAGVCDFIIADANKAKFGYTEVKIGFLPAIVSIFLIRKTGEGNAKHLLMSGDIIDAKRAYEIGLANYIADDSLQYSIELANKLLQNSDQSMAFTKQMINNISGLSVRDAVDYCIRLNTISRSSEDFKKGLENFLNKK